MFWPGDSVGRIWVPIWIAVFAFEPPFREAGCIGDVRAIGCPVLYWYVPQSCQPPAR
jgi:hypothetical protein